MSTIGGRKIFDLGKKYSSERIVRKPRAAVGALTSFRPAGNVTKAFGGVREWLHEEMAEYTDHV